MSCISEILKIKGDKEFIPIPYKENEWHHEIVIEGGGNYKEYEYLITFNDMGFRCAYVGIPESHPIYTFHNEEYNYPNFDVHGGITFFDDNNITKKLFGIHCTDKWIGFDAGHYYDISDFECTKKYFPTLRKSKLDYVIGMSHLLERHITGSAIRSFNYMEEECKKLIDQLRLL